jgi:lipoprotein-anchoring transpeptidase ErfK/SrfK
MNVGSIRLPRVVVAGIAAVVVLLVVIVLWPASTENQPVVSPTSTTIDTGQIFGDVYTLATAVGASVTVLTYPPAGVEPAGYAPTPAPDVSPIPRDGLSAAGVTANSEAGTYTFPNPTFFGNPLVFPVVKDAGDWLEVRLPARPNGKTGWVARKAVTLSRHDAQIDINLTQRTLQARVGGVVVVDAPVTIGFDENPTPVGKFFITDIIAQSYTAGPYGPFVLATSAYSEALEKFDDGLPVVAIHGTNEPNLIGEPVSNGCIRLTNDLVTLLAEQLPPGTPVVVTA